MIVILERPTFPGGLGQPCFLIQGSAHSRHTLHPSEQIEATFNHCEHFAYTLWAPEIPSTLDSDC